MCCSSCPLCGETVYFNEDHVGSIVCHACGSKPKEQPMDEIATKLTDAYELLIFVKDCRVVEQNFNAATAYRHIGDDLKKLIERAKDAAEAKP
jgi:hypothetical protein